MVAATVPTTNVQFPDSGRVVSEFDQPALRELIQPPFRIVYRRGTAHVHVVRVWRSELPRGQADGPETGSASASPTDACIAATSTSFSSAKGAVSSRKAGRRLHAEPHEQRHSTVRHVDDLPYRGTRPVEHGDECKLFREIATHRIGDAVVQVLRECGRVEVPIEIGGLIVDHDFSRRRPPPSDQSERRLRKSFEGFIVTPPVAENRCRHREDDAGRAVASSGKHVVYQEAMDPTVPVLKWVDEDEGKRADRGGHDRIDAALNHSPGQTHPGLHQARHVFGTRADEVYVLAVATDGRAHEVLERAPVGCSVARVDDLALQADQRGLVARVEVSPSLSAATNRSVRAVLGISPSRANEERVSFVKR